MVVYISIQQILDRIEKPSNERGPGTVGAQPPQYRTDRGKSGISQCRPFLPGVSNGAWRFTAGISWRKVRLTNTVKKKLRRSWKKPDRAVFCTLQKNGLGTILTNGNMYASSHER